MADRLAADPDPRTISRQLRPVAPVLRPERKMPALGRPDRIHSAAAGLQIKKYACQVAAGFLLPQGKPVPGMNNVCHHEINGIALQMRGNLFDLSPADPDVAGFTTAAPAGTVPAGRRVETEIKPFPAEQFHDLSFRHASAHGRPQADAEPAIALE